MTPMKKLISAIAIAAALGAGVFALSTVLPAGANTGSGHPRGDRVKAALDKLVEDGTITQTQEDAVLQALRDAFPDKGGRHFGRHHKVIHNALEISADTIGITLGELRSELAQGKSIADVANEHNVNPDDVEQALVDAATQKINEAVASGRLSQEKADALIAKLPAIAERIVNHHKADKAPAD